MSEICGCYSKHRCCAIRVGQRTGDPVKLQARKSSEARNWHGLQFSLAEFLHVCSCEGLGDTKGFLVPAHFFAYCYSRRVVVVGLSGLLLFLLYSSLYDWLQGGAGLNFPPYPSCVSCCLHQLPSYRTRIESPEFNTHNTVNLKILTLLNCHTRSGSALFGLIPAAHSAPSPSLQLPCSCP